MPHDALSQIDSAKQEPEAAMSTGRRVAIAVAVVLASAAVAGGVTSVALVWRV